MQSRMQKASRAVWLPWDPPGRQDGKSLWSTAPLRCRLVVLPSAAMTRHRLPAGRGSAYLHAAFLVNLG